MPSPLPFLRRGKSGKLVGSVPWHRVQNRSGGKGGHLVPDHLARPWQRNQGLFVDSVLEQELGGDCRLRGQLVLYPLPSLRWGNNRGLVGSVARNIVGKRCSREWR